MTMSVLPNLYFSIVVLAIIAFMDVLVKFKNARALKFFFLLLPFSIGAVGLINSFNAIQFVYFIAFFKAALAISVLNIFSILYFPKFKKWTLYFSFIMLLVILVIMLVNNNFLPRNPILEQFRFISIDEELNILITPVVVFVRFTFIIISGLHLFYFWYVIYNKINLNNIYYEKIRKWTSLVFLLSLIIIFINIAIYFTENRLYWGNLLSIFISFYLLLLVLKRPTFLNTAAKKIAFGHKFNLAHEVEIEELTFIKLFYEHKYFAQNDASLEEFAQLLRVSTNLLTQFIQKKYNMSFNDLVNKNRVNYFFEIVQNPAYYNYTIDALAREVGFSSRQHLNKPFKKFHGGNPSDLISPNISPE